MIISHSLRARLRKGSRPWAFYGAEGLLTNEGHLAIIKLNNRMHWTGSELTGNFKNAKMCIFEVLKSTENALKWP